MRPTISCTILFYLCYLQLHTCSSSIVARTRYQKISNFTSRWFSFKSLRFSTFRGDNKPKSSILSSSSPKNVQSYGEATRFLESGSLNVMLNESIPYKLEDIWKSFFQPSQGYKNFLVSDGDFDITTSEWNEIPKSANTQIVPEDVGHFSFSQSRQFSFLHKRTTMLFIGPKNAPTAQMHYTKTDTSRAGFGVGSMSSAVFLIVSKFDGVPFSDCFKVLQYWVLERGKKQDTTKVTCGINVHFHKPTMMRSKIESGVKDEMASQVRRLLTSIIKSVKRGGTPHINKINSNPSFQPFSILGGSDTTKLVDVGKSTMYTNMLNLSSNKWIHILFSVIVICSVVTLLTR